MTIATLPDATAQIDAKVAKMLEAMDADPSLLAATPQPVLGADGGGKKDGPDGPGAAALAAANKDAGGDKAAKGEADGDANKPASPAKDDKAGGGSDDGDGDKKKGGGGAKAALLTRGRMRATCGADGLYLNAAPQAAARQPRRASAGNTHRRGWVATLTLCRAAVILQYTVTGATRGGGGVQNAVTAAANDGYNSYGKIHTKGACRHRRCE